MTKKTFYEIESGNTTGVQELNDNMIQLFIHDSNSRDMCRSFERTGQIIENKRPY
jgi:hypothetical protein